MYETSASHLGWCDTLKTRGCGGLVVPKYVLELTSDLRSRRNGRWTDDASSPVSADVLMYPAQVEHGLTQMT
jgi:hypothetical protein